MKGIIVLLSIIIAPALCGPLSLQDSLRLSRPVVDGGWTDWTAWTNCSRSCGRGTQSHSRKCTNPRPSGGGVTCIGVGQQTQLCNDFPCQIPGKWGAWGNFSACSVTCGNGTQIRFRNCDKPAPQNGGAYCIGSNSSSINCKKGNCPAIGKARNYPLKEFTGDFDHQQVLQFDRQSDLIDANYNQGDNNDEGSEGEEDSSSQSS